MLYFIGDTETTGIGSVDEVIQFAGILANDKFQIIKFINFYCMPSIVIPYNAVNVHGITNEAIPRLSKGKFFEECIEEYDELKSEDITFIFYNADFDKRLINQTLEMNGIQAFDFGSSISTFREKGRHNLCAMKTLCGGGRRKKLSNLYFESFNEIQGKILSPMKLDEITLDSLKKILDKANVKYDEKRLKAHDALYDSYMTYLLLRKNRRMYE